MASSLERTLRRTTLISFLFAIPLLIPATIESVNHGYGGSIIGFGFIPLVFTAITSVLYFARERWQRAKIIPSPTSHPLLWAIADFLIFSGYVTMLVIEWVQGMVRLRWSPNLAFLEAYATVPLMLNMVIHAVTFLINLKPAFKTLLAATARPSRECPHCHHRINATSNDEVAQKGSGEGYSLLRGEDYDEDATRASSSEENRVALPEVEEV